ncbi:MAG: hypothetical protein K2U26_09350 [Cyclobacteriaceae bacterium]|nr:hypothetical protein [Cyclobacteriaceae bacterium]
MSVFKYASLVLSFSLSSYFVFGQAARSPFSLYGLGEPVGNALASHQGMGGVGVSNPQYWYLNNQNPALLVFNRLTVFQAGVLGEQRTQSSANLTERSGNGDLNYLALGIPVKPGWWTSSLVLMPYTRLNYQVRYQEAVNGNPNNSVNVTEKGSGGINEFSFSNGVSINKNLSVGVKAAYLFSAIINEYSNELVQTNQTVIISPNIYDRTFVSDFKFTSGVSYRIDSLFKNKLYRLNFGATYDFSSNLRSRFLERIERRNIAGILDSLTILSNIPGRINVPSRFTGGVSLSKSDRWTIAMEASLSDYSTFRGFYGDNPYSQKSWRVSGGFEITPDPQSLSSYLKRTTYRTGVSFENAPYLVNGNAVRDFGITFGLSLPVSRVSSLDLALKVGKKGDKALNTIEENYLKLYFGITFNDQWFIKRRFD